MYSCFVGFQLLNLVFSWFNLHKFTAPSLQHPVLPVNDMIWLSDTDQLPRTSALLKDRRATESPLISAANMGRSLGLNSGYARGVLNKRRTLPSASCRRSARFAFAPRLEATGLAEFMNGTNTCQHATGERTRTVIPPERPAVIRRGEKDPQSRPRDREQYILTARLWPTTIAFSRTRC